MRTSNAYNLGSLMMLLNCIEQIKKIDDSAKVIIDNVDQEQIEFINSQSSIEVSSIKEFGLELRPPLIKNKILKTFNYLKFSLFFGKEVRKKIAPDIVIQLGGDDFSEYYSKIGLYIELIKLSSLKLNVRDIRLVGQTIGPFTGFRTLLVSKVLKGCKLYFRDKVSASYCQKKLGLIGHKIIHDLAFTDLPRQPKILHKVPKLNQVVLVPSGLWDSYSNSYASYLRFWNHLVSVLCSSGYKIVLMEHVKSDLHPDVRVINDIEIQDNVEKVYLPFTCNQAREILARSSFVISGRMHPCVSSINVRTPFVGLGYSIKYEGVLGGAGFSDNIYKNFYVTEDNFEQKVDEILLKMDDPKWADKCEQFFSLVDNRVF